MLLQLGPIMQTLPTRIHSLIDRSARNATTPAPGCVWSVSLDNPVTEFNGIVKKIDAILMLDSLPLFALLFHFPLFLSFSSLSLIFLSFRFSLSPLHRLLFFPFLVHLSFFFLSPLHPILLPPTLITFIPLPLDSLHIFLYPFFLSIPILSLFLLFISLLPFPLFLLFSFFLLSCPFNHLLFPFIPFLFSTSSSFSHSFFYSSFLLLLFFLN